jgi:hypothetical protein
MLIEFVRKAEASTCPHPQDLDHLDAACPPPGARPRLHGGVRQQGCRLDWQAYVAQGSCMYVVIGTILYPAA